MTQIKPDCAFEIRLSIFVDSELLSEFPRDLAEKYSVVPLRRLGKGLLVGTGKELDSSLLQDLAAAAQKPLATILCDFGDLSALLDLIYEGSNHHKPIGELLKDEKVVTQTELQSALERQSQEPRPLGQILLDLGLVSQEELTQVLSTQERSGNPTILPSIFLDSSLTRAMPEAFARRYQVLPICLSDNELVVAASRKPTSAQIAEIESACHHKLQIVPAVPEEVTSGIEQFYGRNRKRRLKELRLGEVLLEEGLITQDQLNHCLSEQKVCGKKLGEILVEKRFVSEDAVLGTVAAKLGFPYRRFATSEIDLELAKMVPRRFAEQNHVLILAREPDTRAVLVAMTDPTDLNLCDILDGIVGPHNLRLKPVLASPANIEAGISYTYQSRGLIESAEEMETVKTVGKESDDLTLSANAPEIKRIVNQLLYSSVTEGASDIHIENLETTVGVRFRIDGVLEDRITPVTKENIANVISILKVDSGLDIAERRRSQDGVFKKRLGKDRFIDFRINVHATPFGEDAVIRILDRDKNLLPLEKLGLSKGTLDTYLRLIENPQGLILFTGPTGSGKTTTLYSTLTYLNKGNKKIVTAEDPIEYVLPGISQYQVNEAIGNTFDDYARRFLRKDPDIILIGEIRDNKTAKACVNAAMTGHLVFSTLHTNDAIGVVRRLQNLDIASELIADSLLLVVSQRLARRVCTNCCEPYTPDPRSVQSYFPKGVPPGLQFVRGLGCEACRFKGYRGRVGLYEFWEVRQEGRRLISRGAREDELRAAALNEDLRVLLADALSKVGDSLTTLEELNRVVSIDQLQRYAEVV